MGDAASVSPSKTATVAAVVIGILISILFTALLPKELYAIGNDGTETAAPIDVAREQLFAQKNCMSHDMRPLAPTKFAGPAVTVLLKKEEHKEGAAASQEMLDAMDSITPASVV